MPKPLQIAEALYHSRVLDKAEPLGDSSNCSLSLRSKPTREQLSEIISPLAETSQSAGNVYMLSPETFAHLDRNNLQTGGAVEKYIYMEYIRRSAVAARVTAAALAVEPQKYQLANTLRSFNDPAIRRSIDKAYEIAAVSLYNALFVGVAWIKDTAVNCFKICLRGRYAAQTALPLLDRLREQFGAEFPQVTGDVELCKARGYLKLTVPEMWQTASDAVLMD